MRDFTISDAEFERSISAVLGESTVSLHTIFFLELHTLRPCLFERLAVARLEKEEGRYIRHFLQDLKNEEVSDERFTQLFMLLCEPSGDGYAGNPVTVILLFGLVKIYRPMSQISAGITIVVSREKPD